MKRRWFLIALCSLIFGLFGAVASAWLPAMVYALAASPTLPSRVVLGGNPGRMGWASVDYLALGVQRASVLWLGGRGDPVGEALPDDAPRWAAFAPGIGSSSTLGYGWPMVGLRWASKGAFGLGGVSSISVSTRTTTAGTMSATGTASFSVSGGAVGVQVQRSNSASEPQTMGTAPAPARDAASNSNSTIVLSTRTPPIANAPKAADILSPLRFSLFGVSLVLPVYPYWPGFLVNTLIYAALALIVVLLLSRRRHRLRTREGLCLTCGYDRRGLSAESPCPECGQRAMNPVQAVATS